MEQRLLTCSAWDVERLRRPGQADSVIARRDRRPLLLATTRARQETVARCCTRALVAGVQPGMNLAEALARCPDARIVPFDAGQSWQAMDLLALWCHRFSPVGRGRYGCQGKMARTDCCWM